MAPTPKLEKGSPAPPEGTVGRNALVVVAVVLAGAALHWLGDLLTPLALAIFLMVMIESFTRLLKRIRFLPNWAAMNTALALLVAAFLLSVFVIYENAAGFVDQLTGYAPRINDLIASIWKAVGQRHPPTINQLLNQLHPVQYVGLAADGFKGFVANAAFVLIYLGFLIAARAGFQRKWVMLFPVHEDRHRALMVFEHMRFGVERYLWTQTIAGLMIAIVSFGIMMVAGLDNAFFWAFLIFICGFIPIIGPMVGASLPAVFALGQFDSYVPAVVLLALLNCTHAAVGTLLLPRMQGKSLNLDPVVVLLSLAFWGKIWGLAGMFLATPLTVAVMVVLSQFHGSHWISILLSGDGDPLGETKNHKKQVAAEK